MKKTKVIIVGGGIGGLAAALAFNKIGLDYIVLERASQKLNFKNQSYKGGCKYSG